MKKKWVMILVCFLVLCAAAFSVLYLSNSAAVKTPSSSITEKTPSSSSAAEASPSEETSSNSSTASTEETSSNSSEESAPSTGSEGKNRELSIQDLCEKSPGESIEILKSYGLVLPEAYASDPKAAEESIPIILQGLQEGQFQDDVYPFSYTELVELAKRVKAIAIQYDPEIAAKYETQNGSDADK